MLLLFPIFFGEGSSIFDGESNLWRETVQEFQTLFAGILAIAAAWATIVQMQKSEERQEIRHRESFKSANLPKYLAVTRLSADIPHKLRIHAARIDQYMATIPAGTWPSPNNENLSAFVWAVYAAREIHRLSTDSHFSDCASYFTPRLSESLRDCVQYGETITAMTPEPNFLTMFHIDENGTPDWYHAGIIPILGDLSQQAQTLAGNIDVWAKFMLSEIA